MLSCLVLPWQHLPMWTLSRRFHVGFYTTILVVLESWALSNLSTSSDEFQVHSICMSWILIFLSVPLLFNQSSNCFKDNSHFSCALVSGQVRMCSLSSIRCEHLGHCADDWNCHLCMFLPMAKWPDTYFDTQHWQWIGSSCMAWPMDSQSICF